MDTVLSLHGRLALVLVLYYGAVGLWGLALGIRRSGPTSGFRGALVIAELTAIAQGVLGVLVLLLLRPPDEPLHVLYGFALVLAIPLAATTVRDRSPRARSVWLGLAALFAAGLAIRGITTS